MAATASTMIPIVERARESNSCPSDIKQTEATRVRCVSVPVSVLEVLGRVYLTFKKAHSKRTAWTLYQALLLLLLLTMLVHPCSAHTYSWQRPGCHRIGHEREERIANCVVFNITLNVCRGFCESYAVPSPINTLKVNSYHRITSRAECCNIRKTADKKAFVKCFDDNGKVIYRELTYKSAVSCSCSLCEK